MTFINPQYQCNRCKETAWAQKGGRYPYVASLPDKWLLVEYDNVHLCPACTERALEVPNG